MKVLATGATGFIGGRLVAALRADGADVVALVRDPARAGARLPGVRLLAWDAGSGAPPPSEAWAGVDAVVSLAGESIGEGRWTAARRAALRRSRLAGTRALVDAMAALPARPRVFVSASAVGYYGDRGDELLTEASPPGRGFLADLAQDWEAQALSAAEHGVRVVVVRSGIVLARDGGALVRLLPLFRAGVGGRLGSGRQFWPWIHMDDELGILRHALAADAASGALNATAPVPVRNADFTRALAAALHRPALLPAPAFALRLAMGSAMADELLLASQRVVPERTQASGYAFRHPELAPALAALFAGPAAS